MFTSYDKALVTLVIAVLSIINLVWGIDLFGSSHTVPAGVDHWDFAAELVLEGGNHGSEN